MVVKCAKMQQSNMAAWPSEASLAKQRGFWSALDLCVKFATCLGQFRSANTPPTFEIRLTVIAVAQLSAAARGPLKTIGMSRSVARVEVTNLRKSQSMVLLACIWQAVGRKYKGDLSFDKPL